MKASRRPQSRTARAERNDSSSPRARDGSSPAPVRRSGRRRARAAVALLIVTQVASAFSFIGCKREERSLRAPPASIGRDEGVRVSELQPGGRAPDTPLKGGYDDNAYALYQGQQLYSAFNCVGCHAHGGGSIGPPLMDEKWRYGSAPDQIYLTIMEGRPNGMPSFRGKVNEQQAWQLVAYVRSLSGLVSKAAAPNREDHMKANPPGNSVDSLQPTGEAAPQPGR